MKKPPIVVRCERTLRPGEQDEVISVIRNFENNIWASAQLLGEGQSIPDEIQRTKENILEVLVQELGREPTEAEYYNKILSLQVPEQWGAFEKNITGNRIKILRKVKQTTTSTLQ